MTIPIKRLVPIGMKSRLKAAAKKIRYFGRKRFCPVCENHASSFEPMGVIRREEAKCPYCGSLERHRLFWLFFDKHSALFSPPRKKMLHVAPEPIFEKKFSRSENIDYLTADLANPRAMVKMDITDIRYPDNSFDVIYCSHVLEHVLDDRKAMREFRRVLKPSGWAVLQVPINAEKTFEDPSITDPAERERVFGLRSHVRRYGPDYEERLKEAGFLVKRISATDIVSEKDMERMRISNAEAVFYCTKA
jgi:SAM-dependent methyltransferase